MAIEFRVIFEETNKELRIGFQEQQQMQVVFENAQYINTNADIFTGSYEISPRVEAQTIPTADKRMTEDMTIKAIPYYEVSNNENGKTIIIGGCD